MMNRVTLKKTSRNTGNELPVGREAVSHKALGQE
jgi:hypothetical protein